jgi:hypothetical protein
MKTNCLVLITTVYRALTYKAFFEWDQKVFLDREVLKKGKKLPEHIKGDIFRGEKYFYKSQPIF